MGALGVGEEGPDLLLVSDVAGQGGDAVGAELLGEGVRALLQPPGVGVADDDARPSSRKRRGGGAADAGSGGGGDDGGAAGQQAVARQVVRCAHRPIPLLLDGAWAIR
ncbi:hypothetical protein SBADM41S_00153 [Streptomyces badius]